MSWFLIDKTRTEQPKEGTYRTWKPILRTECRHQCVYCAIHEAHFGGLRNFHVEHYRPRKHFPELTDEISNLFYACAICNSFKGASWPGEPNADHSVPAYPCPSEVDFSSLLTVDAHFEVQSQHAAGKFLVERLFLNRPQLIYLRRFLAVVRRLQQLTQEVQTLAMSAGEEQFRAVAVLLQEQAAATLLLIASERVVRYNENDVGR